MSELSMGVIESRFADIIWQSEPVSSTDLWQRAEKEFGWKKSTTFTVLKRLCEKGIFQNNKGTVTAVISHEEYYSMQSENFVNETFKGSLPAFLAAFTSRKTLNAQEVEQLRKIVNEYGEG